jgi:hypothetical protein
MACRACQKPVELLPRLQSLRRGARDLEEYHSLLSPASICSRRWNRPAPSIISIPPRRSLHTTPASRQKEVKPEAKSVLGRLQGVLAGTTASYLIYGASEKIYKTCSAQAAYSISEQDRKDGKITLGPDGEDVGISRGGIWHNGTSFPNRHFASGQPANTKPTQTSSSSPPSVPGRR